MTPKMKKKVLPIMEKPKEKKLKKKTINNQNFSLFLYRILRSIVSDNVNISKKSILIMNNFVNDMLERIATEAGRLVVHGKKTVMTSREIQTAVRFLVPGELATHATSEALKALNKYHKSRDISAYSQ